MQEDMAYDMECYLNGHGSKKREESDLKFRLYHVGDDCWPECLNMEGI